MISVLSGIALTIIAVFLFEFIIFFHEGGHFIAAKKSGVQVNEFSIGMGPKLFSFKKGETQYTLRLLPIGGYCSMEAEDEESTNPRAFTNAKIWKRMIIIIAGAVMNIVLGLIMMFCIVVQSSGFSSTTISGFSENSFSANCGLQAGDTILKLNNYDINTSQDLSFAIATMKCKDVKGDSLEIYKEDCAINLCHLFIKMNNDKETDFGEKTLNSVLDLVGEGTEKINSATSKNQAKTILDSYYSKIQTLAGVENYMEPEFKTDNTRKRFRTDVTVNRNGEVLMIKDVDFYTYLNSETNEVAVSIDFYVEEIEKNFATVIQQTGLQTVSVVRMVWTSLAGLVTGEFGLNDMSGPVGVASVITQVASAGLESGFLDAFNNILYVMMLISINLGIVNMLPFPALDGGRFLFLLIEGIFKKPIPRKVESIVNGVGLVILLIFMLLITVKDVWQLLPF
ncbi:MAG: RIP metalloprotease RseP [Ruminococcus sp.]